MTDALAELDAFLMDARPDKTSPSTRWLQEHPVLANALYARWRGGVDAPLLHRYSQKHGYPYGPDALRRAFQTAQLQGRETYCDE